MAAPVVQTLPELMAELSTGYNPARAVIGQQRAALPAKYDAQRAGVEAKKVTGFNQINDQAIGRGAAFSGIPLNEQADYLSDVYLPGLQQADYQQNEEMIGLNKEEAGFETEIAKSAIGRRDSQVSDLNSWNQMEYQTAAQAREAALNRSHDSSMAAASRAAEAPKGPSNSEIIGNLNTWASSKVGKDGRLSPSTFKAGYQQAAALGMDPDTYVAIMQRYINSSHEKDYVF